MFKLSQIWPVSQPPILVDFYVLWTCPVITQALPYSLAQQNASGSFTTFPSLVLESAVFPRSPSSFMDNGLETKIWVLDGSLFLSNSRPSQQTKLGNTHKHIYMSRSILIFFKKTLCTWIPPISSQHHSVHFSFSLCIFVTSFFSVQSSSHIFTFSFQSSTWISDVSL